jgi:hypothetical protein
MQGNTGCDRPPREAAAILADRLGQRDHERNAKHGLEGEHRDLSPAAARRSARFDRVDQSDVGRMRGSSPDPGRQAQNPQPAAWLTELVILPT